MIYTAYYYSGSLFKGDLIVRDNRFYPGKYFETWPVWLQYVRKHYPNEHIVIFADTASPIPIEEGVKHIDEPYDFFDSFNTPFKRDVKIHIKLVSEHTKAYFWSMQRNLVYAMQHALAYGVDMFWLDNDAFLNTNIIEVVENVGADVMAPQINPTQFTCDSVCTYISHKRLTELEQLGIDMGAFLGNILKAAPTETRMHTLQEGGLYKLFCYGKAFSCSEFISISHLSCYKNFMKFLKNNPLPTLQYVNLVMQLENFDFTKIPNVQLEFHDMYYDNK